jgi:hypothetical protein
MLLQSAMRIFAVKVDYLYEEILQTYSRGSKKKKKNAKNTQGMISSTSKYNSCCLVPEEGALFLNDYEFADQKESLRKNMVDAKWFLEHEKRRKKATPLRVDQRREDGRRDRFVDLPIAFIPTARRSVSSLHHLGFKDHNNEDINIPISEVFSFNVLGFSDDTASQVEFSSC